MKINKCFSIFLVLFTAASSQWMVSIAWAEEPNDTIFLRQGGHINGQLVDATNYTIQINPGEQITGTVNVRVFNAHGGAAVVPMAATVTWGDRTNQYWSVSGHIGGYGWHDLTVNVNKQVPTSEGRYYIVIASAATFTAGQIMSGTSWTAHCADKWYDGNDVGWDWSEQQFEDARNGGTVINLFLNNLPDDYGQTPIGATWVAVEVTSDLSPIAHWKFDDPNNLGHDSSGNGNHLTIDDNGGVSFVTSPQDKALFFTRDTGSWNANERDRVFTYNTFYPGSGGWTIEALIKFTDERRQTIVEQYSEHVAGREPFTLAVTPVDYQALINNTGAVLETPIQEHERNTWVHLAWVYKQPMHGPMFGDPQYNFKLYVNGELRAQTATSVVPEMLTRYATYIGGNWFGSMTGVYYDEVAITNAALDPLNFQVPIIETVPEPEAKIGICVEANSSRGAALVLNGNDFAEGADTGLTYEWYEDYDDTTLQYLIGEGVELGAVLDLGIHDISLIVTNEHAKQARDDLAIKVVDTQKPKVKCEAMPLRIHPRCRFGIFKIKVMCLEDNYDLDPQITSLKINGYGVADGAKVLLIKGKGRRRYNFRWYDLVLVASRFVLQVEAVDSSGNIGRYRCPIEF